MRFWCLLLCLITFAFAAEKPVVTITPYTAADTVYTTGCNYYIAVVSGSTVDLTLIKKDGSFVDMGGTFDLFSEISHPDYKKLTRKQKKNSPQSKN